MSLEVRGAGSNDIGYLIAADHHAQIDAGRRAQIEEWVHGGHCFVAQRERRIVGYCVLNRQWFASFFIALVTVAENERRKGVGTALIEHLIALVPPSEKPWTSTNRSNSAMRPLLPRLGFIASGQIDNLDDDDPELVFVRLPAW